MALGASALVALALQKLPIAAARARQVRLADGRTLVATYDPAMICERPRKAARAALLGSLIDDLRRASALATSPVTGDRR